MERRVYKINAIIINKREIEEIVIDPHVDKHSDHISDDLIIELVAELVHTEHIAEKNDGGFQYFVSEIAHGDKLYKMVWLLEDHRFYVGIITAFRDRRLL
ncbi:MAG: hypothetical protein A2504_16550 [Bdellovibrionales bacterium RIFOXYD12_FULL_39_22]|nr:MAG: hypothetical protein A2404_14115 [Bdellovibrionales bacterium RIFOXYC1_FULL_39_130]OFZ74328.1 MAG: hypothetical protein A2560_17330 [Bdellovibrionales bacterium RIFOXYD1_FULL_39_84]OFZ94075.1 MAG: hypothetical protein A2504_16550 [Bdellovibrionales bacterium RIFOXYD12_FULL_39_22]